MPPPQEHTGDIASIKSYILSMFEKYLLFFSRINIPREFQEKLDVIMRGGGNKKLPITEILHQLEQLWIIVVNDKRVSEYLLSATFDAGPLDAESPQGYEKQSIASIDNRYNTDTGTVERFSQPSDEAEIEDDFYANKSNEQPMNHSTIECVNDFADNIMKYMNDAPRLHDKDHVAASAKSLYSIIENNPLLFRRALEQNPWKLRPRVLLDKFNTHYGNGLTKREKIQNFQKAVSRVMHLRRVHPPSKRPNISQKSLPPVGEIGRILSGLPENLSIRYADVEPGDSNDPSQSELYGENIASYLSRRRGKKRRRAVPLKYEDEDEPSTSSTASFRENPVGDPEGSSSPTRKKFKFRPVNVSRRRQPIVQDIWTKLKTAPRKPRPEKRGLKQSIKTVQRIVRGIKRRKLRRHFRRGRRTRDAIPAPVRRTVAARDTGTTTDAPVVGQSKSTQTAIDKRNVIFGSPLAKKVENAGEQSWFREHAGIFGGTLSRAIATQLGYTLAYELTDALLTGSNQGGLLGIASDAVSGLRNHLGFGIRRRMTHSRNDDDDDDDDGQKSKKPKSNKNRDKKRKRKKRSSRKKRRASRARLASNSILDRRGREQASAGRRHFQNILKTQAIMRRRAVPVPNTINMYGTQFGKSNAFLQDQTPKIATVPNQLKSPAKQSGGYTPYQNPAQRFAETVKPRTFSTPEYPLAGYRTHKKQDYKLLRGVIPYRGSHEQGGVVPLVRDLLSYDLFGRSQELLTRGYSQLFGARSLYKTPSEALESAEFAPSFNYGIPKHFNSYFSRYNTARRQTENRYVESGGQNPLTVSKIVHVYNPHDESYLGHYTENIPKEISDQLDYFGRKFKSGEKHKYAEETRYMTPSMFYTSHPEKHIGWGLHRHMSSDHAMFATRAGSFPDHVFDAAVDHALPRHWMEAIHRERMDDINLNERLGNSKTFRFKSTSDFTERKFPGKSVAYHPIFGKGIQNEGEPITYCFDKTSGDFYHFYDMKEGMPVRIFGNGISPEKNHEQLHWKIIGVQSDKSSPKPGSIFNKQFLIQPEKRVYGLRPPTMASLIGAGRLKTNEIKTHDDQKDLQAKKNIKPEGKFDYRHFDSVFPQLLTHTLKRPGQSFVDLNREYKRHEMKQRLEGRGGKKQSTNANWLETVLNAAHNAVRNKPTRNTFLDSKRNVPNFDALKHDIVPPTTQPSDQFQSGPAEQIYNSFGKTKKADQFVRNTIGQPLTGQNFGLNEQVKSLSEDLGADEVSEFSTENHSEMWGMTSPSEKKRQLEDLWRDAFDRSLYGDYKKQENEKYWAMKGVLEKYQDQLKESSRHLVQPTTDLINKYNVSPESIVNGMTNRLKRSTREKNFFEQFLSKTSSPKKSQKFFSKTSVNDIFQNGAANYLPNAHAYVGYKSPLVGRVHDISEHKQTPEEARASHGLNTMFANYIETVNNHLWPHSEQERQYSPAESSMILSSALSTTSPDQLKAIEKKFSKTHNIPTEFSQTMTNAYVRNFRRYHKMFRPIYSQLEHEPEHDEVAFRLPNAFDTDRRLERLERSLETPGPINTPIEPSNTAIGQYPGRRHHQESTLGETVGELTSAIGSHVGSAMELIKRSLHEPQPTTTAVGEYIGPQQKSTLGHIASTALDFVKRSIHDNGVAYEPHEQSLLTSVYNLLPSLSSNALPDSRLISYDEEQPAYVPPISGKKIDTPDEVREKMSRQNFGTEKIEEFSRETVPHPDHHLLNAPPHVTRSTVEKDLPWKDSEPISSDWKTHSKRGEAHRWFEGQSVESLAKMFSKPYVEPFGESPVMNLQISERNKALHGHYRNMIAHLAHLFKTGKFHTSLKTLALKHHPSLNMYRNLSRTRKRNSSLVSRLEKSLRKPKSFKKHHVDRLSTLQKLSRNVYTARRPDPATVVGHVALNWS
jgi:hypothetical protein